MGTKDEKVAIKGEPLKTPANLNLDVVFDTDYMTAKATWENPDAATKKSNANRYTGVFVRFYLDVDMATTSVNKKAKAKTVKVAENKKKKIKKEVKKTTTQKVQGIKKYLLAEYTCSLKAKGKNHRFNYSDLYPNTDKMVDSVCVEIQGYNSKTKTKKVKKSKKHVWDSTVPSLAAIKQIGFPKVPEISKDFAPEAMRATLKYTSSDEGDGHQLYDTVWDFVVVKVNKSGKPFELVNKHIGSDRRSSAGDNFAMDGLEGRYININEKIEAYMGALCRGIHGDSAYVGGYNDNARGISDNSQPYKRIWAYPHDLKISEVQKTSDDDPLIVRMGYADGNVNRQTDTIQLQRCKDFFPARVKDMYKDKATWRSLVIREGSWEDIGQAFSFGQWAITRDYNTDRPSSGNPYSRSYYRIVTKNATFNSSEYYRVSAPIEVPGYLEVPSAKDEKVDFLEIISGSDGTSVRVTLAYTIGTHQSAPNPSDATVNGSGSDGCELTWAEFEHAWESNNPPTPFEMPDMDVTGSLLFRNKTIVDNSYNDAQWLTTDPVKLRELKDKYEYTSTAYVTGLTEGKAYYFRARRYLEAEGSLPRTYGPYSIYKGNIAFGTKQETVVPSTKPTTVVATVKEMLPVGKDLEISWTFDSDSTQKAWKVLWYDPKNLTEVQDNNVSNVKKSKKFALKSGASGCVLKEGTDASGYTVIPYYTERNDNGSIKTQGLDTLLVKGQIGLIVSMATTGEFTSSAPVLVTYVDPPKAAMGMLAEINAQPVRLTLGTNDPQGSAIVRVTAVDSSTLAFPDRIDGQPTDTIVYSRKYLATELGWTEDSVASPGSDWSAEVPEFSESSPVISHAYTYSVSGGTTGVSVSMIDEPLSELRSLEGHPDVYNIVWYLNDETSEPDPPTSHVVSTSASAKQWTKTRPSSSGANVYYYYCYEYLVDSAGYEYVIQNPETTGYATSNPSSLGWYQKTGLLEYEPTSDTTTITDKDYFVREPIDGTYEWTSIVRDVSLEDAISHNAVSSSLQKIYKASGNLGYYANVQLPLGLELHSGKTYEVSLTILNDERELDSRLQDANGDYQPLKMRFVANYEHEAIPPARAHTRVFSDKNALSAKIVIDDFDEHTPPQSPGVQVTESGAVSRRWTTSLPSRSDKYTEYYHSYQYLSGSALNWSASEYDLPMTELSAVNAVSSGVRIWWASVLPEIPVKPESEVTETESVVGEWSTALPDLNSSWRYCYYAYQYTVEGVTKWTSVARDDSIVDAMRSTSDLASITRLWYSKEEDHTVGDLCDIYRVTPDGAALIAENVSYGSTVVDTWAPYSKYADTRYRVATRTVDGNVDWEDFGYYLPYYAIRFDWGDPSISKTEYTSLEIPYNLTYTDSFKKYFEARHHLGEKKPVGYWEDGVDRTSSFTTDIIKYDSPRDKEALRALASYSGPVMVRRPDGCAYLADVEVNNIGNDYHSPVQSVSFTVTEIALTNRYMAESAEYTNSVDRDYILRLDTPPENFAASKLYETVAQSASVNVAIQK